MDSGLLDGFSGRWATLWHQYAPHRAAIAGVLCRGVAGDVGHWGRPMSRAVMSDVRLIDDLAGGVLVRV